VSPFVLGAVAALALVAALFFLRFWRRTGDGLFLAFAVAFALEALNRSVLATTEQSDEGLPIPYLIRLGAYLVILVGIVLKNRPR
jgi:hypothetical protein